MVRTQHTPMEIALDAIKKTVDGIIRDLNEPAEPTCEICGQLKLSCIGAVCHACRPQCRANPGHFKGPGTGAFKKKGGA